MSIIAIANQKGGVGKTTTSVTLAHGAAKRGYKTLLIDLDSQGNCADSLGIAAGPDLQAALIANQPVSTLAKEVRENLYLLRSDKSTAAVKNWLATIDFKEYQLANILAGYEYDLVIFDCAPSLDVLHTAAMVAADWLIIPTKLDQFSVKGVADMVQTVNSLKRLGMSINLGGVIPTFYDRQTNETQDQLQNLTSAFGGLIMPPIPIDNRFRSANRLGLTLYEHNPISRGLRGYKNGHGFIGGYEQVLDRLINKGVFND